MSPESNPFSVGELRRLSLIRSLLKPSDILVLDEPLENIGPETIAKIIEQLLKIKDCYIFMISHHIPQRLKEHAIATIPIN